MGISFGTEYTAAPALIYIRHLHCEVQVMLKDALRKQAGYSTVVLKMTKCVGNRETKTTSVSGRIVKY